MNRFNPTQKFKSRPTISALAGVIAILFLASATRALATCDGIPDDPNFPNSCDFYRDRNSCSLIRGCTWTPEDPVIQVCNRTATSVSIAARFTRASYSSMTDQGWWTIESGKCQNFFAVNSSKFSFFAKQYDSQAAWVGNAEPICFDTRGKAFELTRPGSQPDCGSLAAIGAYQTLQVKPDDFLRVEVSGAPNVTLNGEQPDPVSPPGNGALRPAALAYSPSTGMYSVRHGETVDQAKTNALEGCQANHSDCELALWLGNDRPACMAILKGPGAFLAWAWSLNGREDAINQALDYCRKQNQSCQVDYTICNDK